VIQLNICITQTTRQSNLKTGINIQLNFSPNMAWVSKSCQKDVCDKRGKQFTEKHNLTRHIQTHVQCSQTYFCNICGKEFSVPIIRNTTRVPTPTQLPVPFLGIFLNRMEYMLRHRALHERSEVRPRKCVAIWLFLLSNDILNFYNIM
jgi:hypothetical protein